jgi:hypothetical protein
MTKGELVELLVDFDDDMQIGFAFPSGDYWKTTIVRTINEVYEAEIKYSDYHEENTLVNRDEETDDENINIEYDQMIVLS